MAYRPLASRKKRIVVQLDAWDRFSHYPRGHWTKILGDVGDRNVESMVILHECLCASYNYLLIYISIRERTQIVFVNG